MKILMAQLEHDIYLKRAAYDEGDGQGRDESGAENTSGIKWPSCLTRKETVFCGRLMDAEIYGRA